MREGEEKIIPDGERAGGVLYCLLSPRRGLGTSTVLCSAICNRVEHREHHGRVPTAAMG